MENIRILVVDDEADIREILKFNLENAGYSVDCACSAEEALGMLDSCHGLILLDVMMGGMSGFRMAELLRNERNSNVPIIFLTALNGQYDLLNGFSAGADDYISKPFSVFEVLARVKAVLKRTAGSLGYPDIIEVGALKVDLRSKMLYLENEPVKLSKKEFEVLAFLVSHRGCIYSREQLIAELWKEAPYVLDRTVDVHIARIRSKLGKYKNCITNRSGYGYVFNPVNQ